MSATLFGLPAPAVMAAPLAHAARPTFNKDVAPILFGHCINCHRAGEIAAAAPLLTYAAARDAAAAIKTQVQTRQMPPWPADPRKSLPFRNDARLDARDIATLAAWADAGAPQGVPADLPPVPPAPPVWLFPAGRPPDAVLSLPEVAVSATGEVPYVQQRVKIPLSEDHWISAMQVQPGNTVLVHHMGITEVSVAAGVSPADLDALTEVARKMGFADDALANMQPAVVDARNGGAYDMLGVYTPGTTFEMYPDDTAKLLKAGANLYVNFNIHYTTTGKPETNRSQLALWFRSSPPQHQLFRAPAAVATLVANGRELLTDDPGTKAEGTEVAIPPIAPYAGNYALSGVTAYCEPIIIYQLQPHAHMRGKDFRYSVVYPDGREEAVLTVPAYDFHWQLAYDLKTPLKLPAGSKLVVVAHYDNSAKNRHLREAGVDPRNCGPDKQAYFRRQNQSWHEMFSPLVQYSIERGKPHDTARVVQAVGCLDRGPADTWVLKSASRPLDSTTQSTSSAALKSARAMPLGDGMYRLLGPDIFSPQRHWHDKVEVKGVLIEDGAEPRLNVTSLQTLAGDCG